MIITKINFLEKIDEKIVLVAVIGSLEAVRSGAITIDEAEKFLFSPRMVEILKDKRCNKKIVNIIKKGCELEDIYSLLPEHLNTVIEELKQESIMLIQNYEEYNETFWLEE